MSKSESQITKLERAGDTYGDIVEFLDWISAHPSLFIGEYTDNSPNPLRRSNQDVIYEYLGIDARALEEERSALLKSMIQLGAGRA